MPPRKLPTLLIASNPVLCPECKLSCIPLLTDGSRIVVRHATSGKGFEECPNKDKMWSFRQPSIEVSEL